MFATTGGLDEFGLGLRREAEKREVVRLSGPRAFVRNVSRKFWVPDGVRSLRGGWRARPGRDVQLEMSIHEKVVRYERRMNATVRGRAVDRD